MKNTLLFLLAFPVLFSAQPTGKYPSLLWKISGNGLRKPSYLYGTMHVSHRAAYHLSDQFFEALKGAEVVGLETDPGKWLENMESTGELDELSRMADNGGSRDFYKTAFAFAFPEKRMFQGILSYDPDIINGLLYRQNQSRENFEESTYVDLFIFQTAAKLDKTIISLENFLESEIRARLSVLPDEKPDEDRSTGAFFQGHAQQVEDAYREGNLDLLDSLSRLSTSQTMQRYLIDERNVSFVNTIDSVIRKSTLFSGVGAAHLPGARGMIELLRARGYKVEPVMPGFSRKSASLREQLEKKKKPVSMTRWFAPDSVYSVALPGKAYPIVDLGYLRYYIHADMVNGSFYTMVRLRHLAPLFNISPDQVRMKVDSLLFEAIPGRILVKKEIRSGDMKGIEIVNRTRNGDEQHYQIFFTPLEMMVFKLGGHSDYASGSEARQFFSSISFKASADRQVNYSPPAAGFSVSIPASYSYLKKSGAVMTGQVEDLFSAADGTKCFGVRRAVYNDFDYLEEDTFELNQLSRNVLTGLGFTKEQTREMAKEQGLPCIRFSGLSEQGRQLSAKIFIKGVHYYLAYQVSVKGSAFDTPFFTSFRLTDFRYLNPLKEITDHEFFFKATDEVTDDALSRFNDAYSRAYSQARPKKDTVNPGDFEFRSGQKHYYSPSSNEFVSISFEKYNDYDYRDSAKLKEQIHDAFRRSSTLMISDRGLEGKGAERIYRLRLSDTATARAIDVKVFFRNGAMYEIDAPADTTAGLSGWSRAFFDSFRPADTLLGKNIFVNKFPLLLADLTSADTVKRKQANISLQSGLVMHRAFADEFISFISGPRIGQVSMESRGQLFVNGGTIGDDRVIAPYTKLYRQYTDSFYLQLCILKGLACTKTAAGFRAFNDLLRAETPLVGDESAVADVFGTLNDSLALCRGFFPGMLDLCRYDEYRDAVYSLLAALVNEKIVAPGSYASRTASILSDANLALKRYNPSAKLALADNQFDHLEKAARELAESIKGSLDGLANNNFYKGTPYLKLLDAGNRHPLVNYAFVLSPFYKTDENVRQFFGKLSKLRSQNIAMPVAINLLKQNVVLNDTLIPYYSRNKYTRAFFYSELEKEKLGDRFDKNYLSQRSLIESVLSSQKQLTQYYGAESESGRRDSLVLVKEIEARNKYQRGKMYIYKYVKPRREEELWSAVFVEDRGSEVNPSIEVVYPSFQVNQSRTEQENINELLNSFYLSYRKRGLIGEERYE